MATCTICKETIAYPDIQGKTHFVCDGRVPARKLANMALSLAVIFNMVVNLFFYSAQGFVNDSVVFFVFKADFADERHHHSETPTDQRNHNLSSHFILFL